MVESLRARYPKTYSSWIAMKQRCYAEHGTSYRYYGGRGITVCERWLYSFENFLADMGERPEGKTLDRWPNHAGNYEPSNCRWATSYEQNNNQRRPQTPRRQLAEGDYCKEGHLVAGLNLYRRPQGWIECKTCKQAGVRTAQHEAVVRARQAAQP